MAARRRTSRTRVRVLTYNVKMLPGPFGEGRKDERRAREIARRLGRYDVVCIQELFDEEVRDIFREAVRDQGFPDDGVVEKLTDDWLHEDSGLFFASRFPIADGGRRHGYEEFDDTAAFTSDSLVDKGIFMASLALTRRRRLLVFHTHMQSDERPHQYMDVRRSQIEQTRRMMVRAFQKERQLSQAAGLYLGDFNIIGEAEPRGRGTGDETTEYRNLLAALQRPRDLFREAHRGPGYTWDGPGNPRTGSDDNDRQRLDYMLALTRVPVERSGDTLRICPVRLQRIALARMRATGVRGVDDGPLSDHYGLDAVLEI